MEEKSLSVSSLVFSIKNTLETSFRWVIVEGEVSNLSCSSSGHWYFTLSDAQASIQVALFKGDSLRNPLIKKIVNGDKITCKGPLSVYAKRGSFQLTAKQLSVSGKGNLLAEFEKLKKKLASEGLFDLDQKKPLPELPQRVAVITAKGAAALQDFLNIYKRRSLQMDIIVVPALVQGEAAAGSLRKALHHLIKYHLQGERPIDVVVITRGGGSLEDLWAFNDEALAWDIYNCPIPVVSAVGHQVDFTICDFVSDVRAETPSAAAEMLTQNQINSIELMEKYKKALLVNIERVLHLKATRCQALHPQRMIGDLKDYLYELKHRVESMALFHRLDSLTGVDQKRLALDDLQGRLLRSLESIHSPYQQRVEGAGKLLAALGPQKVLQRGYIYMKNDSGEVISSRPKFEKLAKNHILEVFFTDGQGKVLKC